MAASREQKETDDARAFVLNKCRKLASPDEELAFMPEPVKEAFGRVDGGAVMELRGELGDVYGAEYEVALRENGVLTVRRRTPRTNE